MSYYRDQSSDREKMKAKILLLKKIILRQGDASKMSPPFPGDHWAPTSSDSSTLLRPSSAAAFRKIGLFWKLTIFSLGVS